MRLPVDLDYAALPGLSRELCDKLIAARPMTLGQAQRLEGITPAAITILLAHGRRSPPAKTASAA
jgi:tRNA uridine 5-carboxymethylaminomethyl modification enzyme